MRSARLVVVASLALILGGCWIQPGYGPTRQGYNPFDGGTTYSNVTQLRQAWRRNIGTSPSRPIVMGSRVVVTAGTRVQAFELSNGTVAWEHDYANPDDPSLSPSLGEPVWRYDGKVHVPVSLYRFGGEFQYDLDTGSESGGLGTGALIVGAPAFSPFASVAVHSAISPAGIIVTLDTAGIRGLVHFSTSFGSAPPTTGPMLNDRSAWVGSGTRLLRFDLDSCDAVPPPLPTGYCYPNRTLDFAANVNTPAAIDGNRVAITDAGGTLSVYDMRTDAIVWSAGLGSPAWSPAVAGESIITTTGAGMVQSFDASGCGAASCAPTWSGDAGAAISGQATISGGVAYVATAAGEVVAFRVGGCGAPTCPAIWRGDANPSGGPTSRVRASPTVSDGRVIVMLDNGDIVVFARP